MTRVPYLTPYGSDYHWFWEWDRLIERTIAGVKTKMATIVGAAGFKQCMNVGFGTACTHHDSVKITVHLWYDGTYTIEGR